MVPGFNKDQVFFELSGDREFRKQIALTYSFLKKFYPTRIDLWMSQFVKESLEAYQGRRNPTSCTKGI
jgi:hypothetical protein